MAITSFVSFLLSLNLILVQAKGRNDSTCPKSFSCGNLTDLSFPFSLSTQPDCGIIPISGCDAKFYPRIRLLPRGDWYDALQKQYSSVWLGDAKFQTILRQHKCQAFNKDFSLPISPSVSFTMLNLYYFFKCNSTNNNTPNITQKKNDHFAGYKMNNGCKGFSIYYKLPGDDNVKDIPADNLPTNCSLIRLPFHSVSRDGDLFDLLGPEIHVEWKLSEDCNRCHYGGGQCQAAKTNRFYCQKGFSLPTSCSMIQLPMASGFESKSNNSDLFDLLAADVSLGWTVSNKCNQCYSTGGQCQIDSKDKFICSAGDGKGTLKKRHLRTTWIVIATVAVFSSTGIFILLFCFRKKIAWYKYIRFWESNAEDHKNIEAFLSNYGSYTPKRYSYSEVKSITSGFKNKLGQGGFGSVYKGSLHNGSHVAVKVLNILKGSGEEFINEVASISRTSHVNIVNLVGFCFEGRKRALIYEFMSNGSLEKFIYEERSDNVRKLGWPILYKTALGIARGLEYLHRGCNTRILHFDIKPHNILLDDDFCPKISDFGLAKLCVKKESVVSMLGARGTIGYIAPEIVCRNLGGVSHKSDVYSYGMMVLEMVGGRKNVDVGVDRTSEIYFPHWLYQRIELDEELQLIGIMNEEEKECARKMVMVSLWCIQTDPSNRPSMTKVVEMLEGNLEHLQIPPKPYLYSPSRSEVDSSIVELT